MYIAKTANPDGKAYKDESDVMNIETLQCIGVNHFEVKCACKLLQNKNIDPENLFIIEGSWAYEKLVCAKVNVKTLLFCPELMKDDLEYRLVKKLMELADNSYQISEKTARKISDRDDPEGCFLVCRAPNHSLDQIQLKKNNIVIILDGLEKPGNIGTIIRTADAAGVDVVISCNQKVKLTHPRLVKASMGSSFSLPVIGLEMDEAVRWLKDNGFKIFLTDLQAKQNCYEANYDGRVAIVAGNEIRGVSKEWYQYECDKIIIPMFGYADSLNVGFATTLVVYEAAMRQRNIVKR